VGTTFDDSAMFQHQNLVRLSNGAQAVSDHKAGAPGQKDREGGLQASFGAGVDAAGRFVQNQDAWIGE
jgi:hypothetical protein